MRTTVATLLGVLVAACGGGGEGSPLPQDASTGVVGAASPQAERQSGCTHQHVYVTVERLLVQKSGSNTSDGLWMDFKLALPRQIDLLNLADAGVFESLGVPLLPLGDHDQVRLVLTKDGHSVQPDAGPAVMLEAPDGVPSGLQLRGAWKGTPGPRLDLVLPDDFSCEQIVQAAGPGVYRLQPTLKVHVKEAQTEPTPAN